MKTGTIPAWLDLSTYSLVNDIVANLTNQHTDIISIILYGSIARHDERPSSDPEPSDVDMLVIFDTDATLSLPRRLAVMHTIGDACRRHPEAPHEVSAMFATRTLWEWDADFIANVAHDGIALFVRGPLPTTLVGVSVR